MLKTDNFTRHSVQLHNHVVLITKTINIMLKIFLTTAYLVIDHSLDIIDATFYQLSALYIKHQVFEEKLNTRFIELCTNIQHS